MATPSIYLVAADLPGRLYIMPCPDGSALAGDIQGLAALGLTVVVSMLPEDEALALGVQDEARFCTRAGMAFINMPIPDFGLPETVAFDALAAGLAARLRGGDSVVVHCRAGIGRSGMVAAAVMMALGHTEAYAVDAVSKARGAAIPDTAEQRAFIARHAERVQAMR